ncbi:FAD-dependent oxidoreductase [uncultured Sphingomonas sp.]|uniref:NAD(P)/FAD-dependent oxidoreductase n=1 Tax=uncultured Sphingomonas sp. TaxID=158754 RepID=UPI0025E16ABF|nr:FAD-dependent oxidoreductase [uncultured Sphingomonas sp.]
MDRVDVLIIGGGIAGASLGAALAPHLRVLLAEAEDVPGQHATGRSAAFWHEGYGGALVAPLTRASRPSLELGGYLSPRGAIHLARAGDAIEIVPGCAVEPLDRAALERLLPGLRPQWVRGLDEPAVADIDVSGLHQAYLSELQANAGAVRTGMRLMSAERRPGRWLARFERGEEIAADVIVNAAGAWADPVAERCGVRPLGIAPKRRTMVQLRLGRTGLQRLPLVIAADGSFYFKGEGDRSIWLSPHDEVATDPCDAAPEELDVAVAIDRFSQVVDWPVERVERSWAGLRSFAPDRLPVFGFDRDAAGFFWCAGQGGFGIQTAPAAAALCAALILGKGEVPVDPAPYDPRRLSSSPRP